MNIKVVVFGLFQIVFFAASGCVDTNTACPIKQVTILIYISQDTPLDYVQMICKELQKVAATESVNVLVYSALMNGAGKVIQAPIGDKASLFEDRENIDVEESWVNNGINACRWAHEKFPSEKFVLVFCASSRGSPLAAEQIQQIVSYLFAVRGTMIDLVAFDADMMASLEIARMLAPCAKFMVASEGYKSSDWFPYLAALKYAVKDVFFCAGRMAFDMCNAYEERYEQIRSDYSLCAIDLSKVQRLSELMDKTVLSVHEILKGAKSMLQQMLIESSCCSNCTFFGEQSRLDLGHFLANLQSQIARAEIAGKSIYGQLRKNIASAKRALNACIVQYAIGAQLSKATGLTFVFRDIFC